MGGTPGMISDSLQYYAAATTLTRSGSLTVPIAFSQYQQFDASGRLLFAHPFVLWPPGYPISLAIVSRLFGVSMGTAAAVVNILSLVATLAILEWLMARAVGRTNAVAGTALFGVLPPVQRLFRIALSEPLFVALCALAIASLIWWLENPSRRARGLWIAALATGAAINVRYLGVTLVLVQAVCLVWAWSRLARRTRWSSILSVAAGAALGSAFLVQRLATWGCLFCEPRLASTQGFVLNVRDLIVAALQSLPAAYDVMDGPWDVALSLGGLIVVVLAQRRKPRDRHDRPEAEVRVLLIFASIYLMLVLALRTVIEFNSLDPRLIAPAAFVLLAIAIAAALRRLEPPGQWRAAGFGIVMFVAANIVSTYRVPWRGLSDPALRHRRVVEYSLLHVAREPLVPLFTPDATFVQLYAGIDAPVYFMPPDEAAIPVDRNAIVAVRPMSGVDVERRIRQLDAAGTRILEEPTLIVWKIGPRPSR